MPRLVLVQVTQVSPRNPLPSFHASHIHELPAAVPQARRLAVVIARAPLPAALRRGVRQHLRRRILHVVAPICRADKAAAARRDAAA